MKKTAEKSSFPPVSEFESANSEKNEPKIGNLLPIDIPFLGSIKKDGDISLILGLLLLLISDKSDKLLLAAFMYILM